MFVYTHTFKYRKHMGKNGEKKKIIVINSGKSSRFPIPVLFKAKREQKREGSESKLLNSRTFIVNYKTARWCSFFGIKGLRKQGFFSKSCCLLFVYIYSLVWCVSFLQVVFVVVVFVIARIVCFCCCCFFYCFCCYVALIYDCVFNMQSPKKSQSKIFPYTVRTLDTEKTLWERDYGISCVFYVLICVFLCLKYTYIYSFNIILLNALK